MMAERRQQEAAADSPPDVGDADEVGDSRNICIGPFEADILVSDSRWDAIGKTELLAERALDAVIQELDGADRPEAAELSLLFAGDERLQALNDRFRGKNQTTNVLSFPASFPGALGDIAISFDRVTAEAETYGFSFEARAAHMVIHGFLHLLGYDHAEDEQAREMESIETAALARLGYDDPYDRSEAAGAGG